jgi:hypothetical protein
MFLKRTLSILLLACLGCSTIAPTVSPIQNPSATSMPSAVPTGIPTMTRTPDPFAVAELISYDINNDIWVNIEGRTENRAPKMFAFRGEKGQQILLNTQYPSIFSDGGWIEETRIFAKNGESIQAESTTEMGGWSGTLPLTQDYLIDLTPVDERKVEFVLQIVNVPVRQASGYFTYVDEQNDFEITYSQDDFVLTGNDISNRHLFSVAMDTDKYFVDTILQMSGLTLSVSTICIEPYDPDYAVNETINGIVFKKFAWNDAATGTAAELVLYTTRHNDQCYQFFIRTLYIREDKFPDTGKKDFSRSVLYTKYYRLLNTFKFIK